MAWPGVDDQPGYDSQQSTGQGGYDQPGYDQPGYGQGGYDQPGYDQPGYGRTGNGPQDYDQPGSGTGRSRAFGETDQPYPSQGAQGYQAEGYQRPGSDRPVYAPSGYTDQGSGQGGYGSAGYGLNALGQPVGPSGTGYQQDAYGQGSHAQDSYAQNGTGSYTQDPYAQNGTQGTYAQDPYGQGGYGREGYRQDAYGTGGYGPDAYAQPGYEQPGYDQSAGSQYGRDDFAAPGQSSRSAGGRSAQRAPQRLAGIRMVLYLLASVVGVVVIVLLVVHLTKTGTNSPATGSTPSTGSTPTGAAGTASQYVFTAAPKAGPFALSTAATRTFTHQAETAAAPVAAQIKAREAGTPGRDVIAVYNLGNVTTPGAPGFKAAEFVGYDGRFNVADVIKYEKTLLVSTRLVPAGSHGGEMMCGYSRSTGSDTSECVWVTDSTFGQVKFIEGSTQVKYIGASNVALIIRNAVEVQAG